MTLINNLRKLSLLELENELLESKQEQFKLRLKKQSVKSHLFSQVRKRIARIKTLITEKKRVKV